MTIEAWDITTDTTDPSGNRTLEYTYTDHLGTPYPSGQFTIAPPEAATFDANADMLSRIPQLEARLADNEVDAAVNAASDPNTPIPTNAEHQDLTTYYRRVLGRLMLFDMEQLGQFNRTLDFFRAVEVHLGNPPNSRGARLGVLEADYDLIEARYNQHAGISSFIAAEEGRIWSDLPSEFE